MQKFMRFHQMVQRPHTPPLPARTRPKLNVRRSDDKTVSRRWQLTLLRRCLHLRPQVTRTNIPAMLMTWLNSGGNTNAVVSTSTLSVRRPTCWDRSCAASGRSRAKTKRTPRPSCSSGWFSSASWSASPELLFSGPRRRFETPPETKR